MVYKEHTVPMDAILPLDRLSDAKSIHQYSWLRPGLEGPNVLASQLADTYIMQHSEDQHTEPGTSMFQHFIPVSVLFTWHNCFEILTSRSVRDEAAPHFQSFLTGDMLATLCIMSGCIWFL